MLIARREIQAILFWIWTLIAVSISYDNIQYATSGFTFPIVRTVLIMYLFTNPSAWADVIQGQFLNRV